MKKTYMIIALMGLMIAMAACSSEEPAAKTGNADVTFSVNLNDIDSRAISDGTTVDQLIFAVYDEQGNELEALRQDNIQIEEDKHATVTTNVVRGQSYTFVFWAQKSGNSFYNTTNLKDVVVSYEGEANDENRDAFTASYTIEVTQDFTQEVTLRRPFAQVDYVCDLTEWENLKNATYQLVGSDLTIASGAYTHINLLTGEASQPTTVPVTLELPNDYNETQTFDFIGFVSTMTNNIYQDLFTTTDGDMFWLSMNYILATNETTNLGTTKMNIYGLKNFEPCPVEVTLDKVPIMRNHRTVVYVSNLTKIATVIVIINPGYGEDY